MITGFHMATKTAPVNTTPIDERSRKLRETIVRAIKAGNRGHVGSSFSLVEIFRVLYDDVLRYDATNPRWPGRDRCILSKGHGCLALYAVLADKGFFPECELWKFCKPEGILGGHPEYGKVPGVEASTGSLGTASPSASAWPSMRASKNPRTAPSSSSATANPMRAPSGKPPCAPPN